MRGLAVAVTLLLVGCGGHHNEAPLNAPFIQNLSITALTPLVEGRRGVYEFRAEFFDPDGDLDGGSCTIDTSIGSAELPLSFSPGSNPAATFGTVICVFETIVLGRIVSGSFSVADRRGLGSNGLGFTLPAERVKRRT